MTDHRDPTESRRRFLKLVGGSAVLIPIAGLSGCSGEKEAAAPAAAPSAGSKPAAAPKAATRAPGAGGGMPKLSEDDPQAKSLGYVHDATKTDTAKYPRYKAGQVCDNCALYQAGDDPEWGGCSIFPGKLVNASGWCNVYAPKS